MWINIVQMIVGGLAASMATLVGRALLALGIAYVTFTGFDVAMSSIYQQIQSNFSGIPTEILSFLAWCWVDKAISIIVSAYTASVTIKLAGGTTLTKMVAKS